MPLKRGFLTERQYEVLLSRGKGLSQRETAQELHTTRANVSMIERRAVANIRLARDTLRAHESTLTEHHVRIRKDTRVYDIPAAVLREGDRFGVHLRSNVVDIIRMVRAMKPPSLKGGKTSRSIGFVFNQRGKLWTD